MSIFTSPSLMFVVILLRMFITVLKPQELEPPG